MDIEEDDDELLAQAVPFTETEQQQALALNLEESQPQAALADRQQQLQQQRRPHAPPPIQNSDDEDMGIGDDELEEFLREQEQHKQQGAAAEVLDDDFFPDDLPAQQCPPAPSQKGPQREQRQQGPGAMGINKHNHAPTQTKRAAGSPAPTSAPNDAQAKRPRREPSNPVHGASAAAAVPLPDNLDHLFEDDEEPSRTATATTPTRHAVRAHAVGGVVGEASPAPSKPLAPAYQAPRVLASEVEGECMPVTSSSGFRVYCKLHAQQQQQQGQQQRRQPLVVNRGASGAASVGRGAPGATPGGFSLLAKPMRQMMQELEDARMSQLLADSRAQAEARQEEGMDEGTGIGPDQDRGDMPANDQSLQGQVANRCTMCGNNDRVDMVSNRCATCTFVLSESKHRATDRPALPASNANQSGARPPVTPPQQQASVPQAPGGSLLWVNKYAPQSFMSLLSDEQTNRAVAKWVKSWDPCVFGTSTGPSLNQLNQQQGAGGRGGKAGKQGSSKGSLGGAKGGDGRPEFKAILLAGPPGLGKTTLAHVVARHCGYQPYEINASDDRTATALTQRVTDAVQMKPVLGSRKPNLVVIDEIDGATGGAEGHSAIAALVKIITAGSKQQAGEDQEEGDDGGKAEPKQASKSGKKGKGLPPLARPLICIANDLYAPALRPLREVAQIFQFKEPNVEKLVSRLQHICNLEHVRVDKSALYALVQRAGVDIRSCLNTLQLLAKQAAQQQRPGRGTASRPTPYIKSKQVEQLNIGIKDTTKGVFAVWDELLHLPGRGGVGALHLGPSSGDASGAEAATGGGGRIQKLYSALQDFGEHELVMAGLHENLHSVHFLDVHMRKTSELLDSLAQADLLISVARRTVSLHLLSYVPATALLVHLSAAQQERPHLVWPKPIGEANRRMHASLELMRSWATHRVTPRVLQAYNLQTLITEIGPALIRVLAPSLRAMAPNLLTPSEHAAIRHTTDVMVAYGLSYCLDEGQQQAARPLQGAKASILATLLAGSASPPPRPVPLVPEIDCVVHNYPISAPTSAPSTLSKGLTNKKGAALAAAAAAAEEDGLAKAEPVRPVPLVLRQMLNQQVLLANIRQAEAGGEQEPSSCSTPLPAGKENTPMGARREPRSTPGRMQQVSFMEEDVAMDEQQLEQQHQQQQQQLQQQQPMEGNREAGKGEGKPLAPVNWLTSLRTTMSNKRKHQQQQHQQRNKNQAGAGSPGTPGGSGSRAGKPQFSKLYRFNEGYTNAVKRPLLIKDLL